MTLAVKLPPDIEAPTTTSPEAPQNYRLVGHLSQLAQKNEDLEHHADIFGTRLRVGLKYGLARLALGVNFVLFVWTFFWIDPGDRIPASWAVAVRIWSFACACPGLRAGIDHRTASGRRVVLDRLFDLLYSGTENPRSKKRHSIPGNTVVSSRQHGRWKVPNAVHRDPILIDRCRDRARMDTWMVSACRIA